MEAPENYWGSKLGGHQSVESLPLPLHQDIKRSQISSKQDLFFLLSYSSWPTLKTFANIMLNLRGLIFICLESIIEFLLCSRSQEQFNSYPFRLQ